MMMPPPPAFYPPPPPPQRGGSFARGIFMTLATSIFGLSLALNVYLLLASGLLHGGSDSARTSVVLNGDAKQQIAVVPINGVLIDASSERFDKVLNQIETDANVKALVIEINSPGGTVTASDEMYARILKFKETKHVPVVVTMGSLAASGGYYISCAGDHIFAQRTTITGSIGVMREGLNFSRLAEKWGIEDTSQHATGADYKLVGSSLRPESEADRAYWLGLLDDAFGTFKEVVTKGRSTKLKAPMSDVANGKVFTASQALQMGLIDQIGYPTDAYNTAASLAGLSSKHVVRYEPNEPLLAALFGAESKTPAAPPTVNLNGVNINFDKSMLDELMTPRLMYLWRGQ
jgi:protease-4